MANIRNRRMDDPEGVNSRIFVGNIPLDTDREILKNKFEVHGPVSGVMVLKGFAFVQFENNFHAKTAIDAENGSDFCGKKLDVKPATLKKGNNMQQQPQHQYDGPPPPQQQQQSWPQQQQQQYGGPPQQHQQYGGPQQQHQQFGGPPQQQQQQQYQQRSWRGGSRGGSRGGVRGHDPGPGWGRMIGRGGYNRGGYTGGGGGWGGDHEYDYDEGGEFSGDMSEMEEYHDRVQSDNDNSHGYGQFSNSRGRGGQNRGGWSGGFSAPPPGPVTTEKPNDVEIICMDKSLRLYGENVEARLKNMSLSVDILFPNPDIPVVKVLGNIASRGVMYAICLSSENQDHGSVTLNVLQGEQQEHRNMPVDDAMSFISKNFSNTVDKNSSGNNSVISRTLSAGHPPDIMKIITFLADDRPLSIMEYDKMIRYLVSKRTETLTEEYGDNIPAHMKHPPVGPQQDPASKAKQEELQNRINKVLRESKSKSKSSSSGVMAPSLQAAIDSLVKNGPNLLSGVSQPSSSSYKPGSSSTNQFSSAHSYQTQSYQSSSLNNYSSATGGFGGGGFSNY